MILPGPRAHHMDRVGEEHRLAQVVGDEHDREAEPLPDVAQHAPQFLAREGVERGERLVEHQQRGLVDQRAAERGALLHAARQFPGKPVAEARRGRPCRAASRRARGIRSFLERKLRAVRLDDLQRQHDVVEHRAPGQQVGVLERHARDLHGPFHRLAVDLHDALGGLHEAGDELHQRGLAAARRADHGGEFALADVDAGAFQRQHRTCSPGIGERNVVEFDHADPRSELALVGGRQELRS